MPRIFPLMHQRCALSPGNDQLWTMTARPLLLLLLALAPLLASGRGRSAALKERTRQLSRMLRTQPPEAALAVADSLLAAPTHAHDPWWRKEMVHYRGHALRLLGRFDEAMAAQVRAYELADSLSDHAGRVDALLSMAAIHMDLDDLAQAEPILREALRLNEEQPVGRSYRLPLVMAALSDYRGQGDSALYWCRVGLPLAAAAQDSFVMADLHFNMGVTFGALGRPGESEAAFRRALAVVPGGGYPHLEARVNESLAYLYFEQGRLEEVPARLDEAERIARTHGAGDLLATVLGSRVEYHLAMKDSARALNTANALLAVKDSLSGVFRERAVAEAQARFALGRMEKELALTRTEAEVNALRAQRSRIAWGALAIISALAVVLIVSFRRQYRMKREAAQRLERDKERLQEENELLLQESLMARFETLKSQIDPHFLFNAMNTLYTLVETEPAKAREFIASFSALYRKVLTSRERTIVPVEEELDLVRHYLFLQRMRFGDSLQVALDLPAHALKGYLPPFTLQMLLENAIKHNAISAAKPLRITVGVDGDRLVVRNDLRPRGTSEAGTGTGLENIRRRYAMLGAEEPAFTLTDTHYTASVPILSQEP